MVFLIYTINRGKLMNNDALQQLMERKIQDVRARLEARLESDNIVSFRTYYLSDYGEKVLHTITDAILDKLGRKDMLDIVYSAAKELIINATKANYKRVLFREKGLDPNNPEEYDKGLEVFRQHLNEELIRSYREKFIEFDYPVVATFYFQKDVFFIKVKNNFTLYPAEEAKIREKFREAHSFANLLDFYMEYGDNTEGAGLGLAMVGILLDESGIDKHAFTLFSNKYNETAAKLEIPLSESYVPRRVRFQEQWEASGLPLEEFRRDFRPERFKRAKID